MIKKILYTLILLSISISGLAQNITYLGTHTFTSTGINSPSTLNYDIPAGQNRIVFVQFNLERLHSGRNGSNHPTTTYANGNRYFGLKIGGVTANNVSVADIFSSSISPITLSNTSLTNYYQSYYLTDKDGLPTGPTTFDWSSIKASQNAGDEIVVNITVFSNVSPLIMPIVSGWERTDLTRNNKATSITTAPYDLSNTPVPAGRTFAERMFVANGNMSQAIAGTISEAFWSPLYNNVLANNNGSNAYVASTIVNESDGTSNTFHYTTGQNSNPNYTLNRNSSVVTNGMTVITHALNPLAKPGVTGNVYLDNNGPATIYGTGTNQAATFINLVGSDGKVVTTATVGVDGKYTIPAGSTLEGQTYTVQLSKTAGIIGSTAPVPSLNTSWAYVGESAGGSTGNDGTPDGKITFIASSTNFSNYNFGVNNIGDNDNDGVLDSVDLDNDNDGILDINEMYCDQNLPPNGVFPTTVPKSGSTATLNPIYNKQLLFWDWSGVTLSTSNPTATKSIKVNNVTYTATLSQYTSTYSMQASDNLTWDGGDHMIGRTYNVFGSGNKDGFKESLYKTTAGAGDVSVKLAVTAVHDNGKTYPVEVIVYDSETTSPGESITYTTNSSPFKLLQKLGTGIINSSSITGENTNTINYLDTSSTTNVNAIYSTFGYNPNVDMKISSTSSVSKQAFGFGLRLLCDTDNDGIPSYLDLDSDNDGCPDSIEGDENIQSSQLNPDGSINITTTGDVGRTPGSTTYGVPNLVNSGGLADVGNDTGQGLGSSQNSSVSACTTKVSIVKDNGQTKYKRPSTSVYTVTVKNEGDNRVSNINFRDVIPTGFATADFTYSAVASVGSSVRINNADTPNSTVNGTGTIDNYINLNVGGTVTYTVKLNIKEGQRGNITNVATITMPAGLTNTLSNTDDDVDTPAIDARNDSFANSAVNNTKGGIVGNVTTNDLLNDVSQSNVNPSTFNTKFNYSLTNDGGIDAMIDYNGNIIIQDKTPPGIYTLNYTICEKADPTNCDTATIIVEVFLDSDGDGISDVIDLDDDNDGILDTVEVTACGSSVTEYFNENFGNGTRTSLALYSPTSSTTYAYEANAYPAGSIDDGEYAILPDLNNTAEWSLSTPGANGNAWVTTNDHTSNDGLGRMAVFNAKNSTSEMFYAINNIGSTGTALPANTTLKVTFWAKNLDKTTMQAYWDKNRSLPSIRTKITKTDGSVVLHEFTTGTIPRDEQWHQYTAYFNTGANTAVALAMFNDMEGGLGNDVAIDDIKIRSICDTDADGIPNELDLDSDNDGCTDAIEGAGNFTSAQLVKSSGSLTSQSPNENFGTSVDSNGIPTIVGSSGQGAGNSYNASVNDCKCIKTAMTTGTTLDTNVGVSAIGNTTGWPQNRKGAFIALESQNKGFVISRLTTTQVNAISKPQEGMMVYDTDVDCLKIYSKDLGASTLSWKCFNVQSCPDN